MQGEEKRSEETEEEDDGVKEGAGEEFNKESREKKMSMICHLARHFATISVIDQQLIIDYNCQLNNESFIIGEGTDSVLSPDLCKWPQSHNTALVSKVATASCLAAVQSKSCLQTDCETPARF